MAKLPREPDLTRLRAIEPAILPASTSALLWRIYFRGGRHPTNWSDFRHFGPLSSRFDHHLADDDGKPAAQLSGIIYAGAPGLTCLAEVFQDTRTIDCRSSDPWLASFRPARALRLLDLTGAWATKAGASAAIATGPRSSARNWARGFYEAYGDIDGLAYRSSMGGNALCCALFERAVDAMPARPQTNRALADPVLTTLLENAADDLGYGLIF